MDGEMSKFKKKLPRYYKGHDMDLLIQKYLDGETTTDTEDAAMDGYLQEYCSQNLEPNGTKSCSSKSAEGHFNEQMDVSITVQSVDVMDEEKSDKDMEKSVLNDKLPKHYKGYDVDLLFGKLFENEINFMKMDEDENIMLDEIIRNYYQKECERVDKTGRKDVVHVLKINGISFYPSGMMTNLAMRCTNNER